MKSNSEFICRKAEKSDSTILQQLAHELNLFHNTDTRPSEDKIKSDWNKFEVFLIESNQKEVFGFIQGYNTYQIHDACAGYEIQNFFIRNTHRKKGAGRILLHYLISQKYKEGVEVFKLTVLKQNDLAAAFYKNLGFEFKDGNILYFCKLRGNGINKFLEI